MDDKNKSAWLKGIGCLLLFLAAPFGFCPFVVMTGSNLQGADGAIFGGSMALAFCLGISGVVLSGKAHKIKRR